LRGIFFFHNFECRLFSVKLLLALLAPVSSVTLSYTPQGKSTYCRKVKHTLTTLGRPCVLISLDPAALPHKDVDIDITTLITLNDIMSSLSLGPNGAILYALEYLEANLDWLLAEITAHQEPGVNPPYLLIDLPGQVELFSHHESLKKIVARLTRYI
jgi:GTPase SAR1 family protein